MERPVRVPATGIANWTHYYYCPKCSVQLEFDWEQEGTHRCPKCGQNYGGEHDHYDRLGISYMAYGKPISVDMGTTGYGADETLPVDWVMHLKGELDGQRYVARGVDNPSTKDLSHVIERCRGKAGCGFLRTGCT